LLEGFIESPEKISCIVGRHLTNIARGREG
jgi:hypothetical protein